MLATVYHNLGIDPHAFVTDQSGRPVPILPGTAHADREADLIDEPGIVPTRVQLVGALAAAVVSLGDRRVGLQPRAAARRRLPRRRPGVRTARGRGDQGGARPAGADWNKGDLDAFLEGYWHSPDVVFQSGGDRHDGFDAMRDRYRKRYKAEGKAMGKVAFSERRDPAPRPRRRVRPGGLEALTCPTARRPAACSP